MNPLIAITKQVASDFQQEKYESVIKTVSALTTPSARLLRYKAAAIFLDREGNLPFELADTARLYEEAIELEDDSIAAWIDYAMNCSRVMGDPLRGAAAFLRAQKLIVVYLADIEEGLSEIWDDKADEVNEAAEGGKRDE
jgi:hypothetical protein